LPFEPFELGGVGHGLGLRVCEPPSIARNENAIAETGMALIVEPSMVYIEPSMVYQIDVGGERRRYVSVHAENRSAYGQTLLATLPRAAVKRRHLKSRSREGNEKLI
jgi:hypothetical protein